MISQQFSLLAAALSPAGSAWYIRDTLRGSTQPNRVSWAGWTLAPLVSFAAEVAQGASLLPALPVLGFGLGPGLVFAASFYNPQAYWKLGWLDAACSCIIVGAIAAWAATGEGNIAIALSICADGAAATPTIVKSWQHPHSESISTYLTGDVGAVLTLLTLRKLTFATSAFLFYVILACTLIAVLIARKWKEKGCGRATLTGRATSNASGRSLHHGGELHRRGRDLRHRGSSRKHAVLRTAGQRAHLQRYCAPGILMPRLRRPGSPWRLLVHTYNSGWRKRKELPYGKAYEVSNNPAEIERHKLLGDSLGLDAEFRTEFTCLPGTEFDELVVGRWFHLEQMNDTQWWMNVGSVTVNVTADRDGRPREVAVYGPGDYDDINPNVTYSLTWSVENVNDHKPAHRKPTRWQLMMQRHKENKAQRLIRRHARRRQRRGGGEHVKED